MNDRTEHSYYPETCNLPGHVHGCAGRAGGEHELTGDVPLCELCGKPDSTQLPDWNPETGNHATCEEEQQTIIRQAGLHPGAELTGGTIPAHFPGAYPRLSCCGGPVELVEAPWQRPIEPRRFAVGDRVIIRPEARSSFEGDIGTVSAVFTYSDAPATVIVRLPGLPGLSFAASQLDLAEVGDRMYDDARRSGATVVGWR